MPTGSFKQRLARMLNWQRRMSLGASGIILSLARSIHKEVAQKEVDEQLTKEQQEVLKVLVRESSNLSDLLHRHANSIEAYYKLPNKEIK